MPPLTRRRAGAGEASIALRRDAYVGVGRRGSAGLLRARAAFDVRIHMYLHTTKNFARRAPSSSRRRSRGWTWRRRRSPGTASRPASEASVLDSTTGVDDYFPRASQLSHGAVVPPSRTRTRSEPPAKSGVTLGRTRIP